MLIHIILGLIIGCFIAPNRKIGFIVGFICGVVWGVIQLMFMVAAEDRALDSLYTLMLIVVHGLITGLFALVATHAKMKKKAKSMQAFTKKFD